ncbi:hypothetical protein HID58_048721 [Brassica napus]|uniref:DNA replication licensing factor MCM3 n=1 Tax=Brassica napus TaxID=3708 RepID=A0ABQ8B3X1_BRANA|nr:hypothetical protein HID58_048721 [Brassica napus]
MDVPEETRLRHKRDFIQFLENIYMDEIKALVQNKRHRLIVNVSDIHTHFRESESSSRILKNPIEYMQSFCDAATEATRNIDPKYLKEGEQVLVGFEGHFVSRRVTPRELLSEFIGSLVCVEGIVTKCSLVRPKVVKSVHFCPSTGEFTNREYRDITSHAGLPTGSVYPTRDDNGNLLVTEYGLCKYKDHQTLSIQEVPENAAPGQLPRSVDVIAEDDLVDLCKPGDRVAVVGIYKALPGKSKGSVNGVFRTILIANNISLLNKEANAPIYTQRDLQEIKKIAARDDAFDLLSRSLAPSIYGHAWIKKAVILLMLGGMEKNLKNGTHLRGDINMMMVGDPSVAKSQLLRAIMNIAPLAISTTGRGSSGVGLTAAVTSDQETGERRLEAGAMVLADKGIVCIDEFDKMNDQDRYDRSLTPTKNIGLPDSLLSRFDLLFIVLDQMDAGIDSMISEHVLRMHRYQNDRGRNIHIILLRCEAGPDGSLPYGREDGGESEVFVKYNRMLHGKKKKRGQTNEKTLTIKFLKKYIHYAKHRIQPELTDEASERIAEAYADLRNAGSDTKTGGTLPITARTLETIIRLATAHAKMKLSRKVTKADAEAALKLMNFAIYHQELTEMDEREQEERQREQTEQERTPSGHRQENASANVESYPHPNTLLLFFAGSPSETADPMDVDETPVEQFSGTVSAARIEAFERVFGQHMRTNRLDDISIADIETIVNNNGVGASRFSADEIMALLEKLQDDNKVMISDGKVHII